MKQANENVERYEGWPLGDAMRSESVGSDDGDGDYSFGNPVTLLLQGSGEVEVAAGLHFDIDTRHASYIRAGASSTCGLGVGPAVVTQELSHDALALIPPVFSMLAHAQSSTTLPTVRACLGDQWCLPSSPGLLGSGLTMK